MEETLLDFDAPDARGASGVVAPLNLEDSE